MKFTNTAAEARYEAEQANYRNINYIRDIISEQAFYGKFQTSFFEKMRPDTIEELKRKGFRITCRRTGLFGLFGPMKTTIAW